MMDDPLVVDTDERGNRRWWSVGADGRHRLHRETGPAVELADGHREWWSRDRRHRADGPAVMCMDGSRYWYRDGRLHREDGPAVERANGRVEWWIDGVRRRDLENDDNFG